MFKRVALAVFLILAVTATSSVSAQFTQTDKRMALDSVFSILEMKYIFPEVASKMENTVRARYLSGSYDTIQSAAVFAKLLTKQLQEISCDQHLKVEYSPRVTSSLTNEKKGSGNGYLNWLLPLLKENKYGIAEKKILAGNIGYLNLPLFGPLEYCADSIIGAMRFVENTDALIIDLRACRGSLDEYAIPFFASYFFQEPVHLSDFYDRAKDFTQQFWTAAWVPGKKYVNKPVYILTSGRTFSGGEAIAFSLQQQKRAVVVGEVTRGGAHPTELYEAGNLFKVAVPYARTIDPVTKTNWEGTGVQPDTLTPANKALYMAHTGLLTLLLQAAGDDNKMQAITHVIERLEAGKPEFKKIVFELEGYEKAKEVSVAGSFNYYARKSSPLKQAGTKWIGEIELEKGKVLYAFVVDGQLVVDPRNPVKENANGTAHSVLLVK